MARIVPIRPLLHPLALVLQIPVCSRLRRRGGVANGVAVINGDRRAQRILEHFALIVADDHQDVDAGCGDIALQPVHGGHRRAVALGHRVLGDLCRSVRRQRFEQFVEGARRAVEIVDRRPAVDAIEHLLPVLDRRHQHRRMRRAERRHHLRHWTFHSPALGDGMRSAAGTVNKTSDRCTRKEKIASVSRARSRSKNGAASLAYVAGIQALPVGSPHERSDMRVAAERHTPDVTPLIPATLLLRRGSGYEAEPHPILGRKLGDAACFRAPVDDVDDLRADTHLFQIKPVLIVVARLQCLLALTAATFGAGRSRISLGPITTIGAGRQRTMYAAGRSGRRRRRR